MPKHDFYADPTVFDHWQSNAGSWVCSRLDKLCPYAWFGGFSLVAIVCALVGAAVFANILQNTPGWNQLLAQSLTVVIALIACNSLLEQAIKAWPTTELPAFLVRVVRCHGGAAGGTACGAGEESRAPDSRPVARVVEREAAKDFFAEVRAAGVNVAVARSLFVAGIRSSQQLCAAGDTELLRMPGIGPATLQRLRLHFDTR